MSDTRETFLDMIKGEIIKLWESHRILPSVAAAQAAHESDNGRSQIANEANNFFGLKARNSECPKEGSTPVAINDPVWTGEVRCFSTHEYWDGEEAVRANEPFRVFQTWQQSVSGYGDFLHEVDFYDDAFGRTDPEAFIRALMDGGYATDPIYVEHIMRIISEYDLTEWDRDVLNDGASISGATKK
ncbi:glycoside hydrolase family 73 protein [Bacillus sp. Marseille-P3800]|uniref:glycoside hydrolase family 73 protein n=1 Tax=Bacillus sp. Marseille-P3800 TaxID=2014782 RepID=UPI000C069666|nr:glucosaminidase domain-containing protein [Bacillus sp. Marseille-P3800]